MSILRNKNFYIWEGIFNNFNLANKIKKGPGFNGKKWKAEQSKIFKICKDNLKYKKKNSKNI